MRSPSLVIKDLLLADPILTHADETLRRVADAMAQEDVTTLPVTARDDANRVVGLVSLPQLLVARRRDQQEARDRQRILSVIVPKSRSQAARS